MRTNSYLFSAVVLLFIVPITSYASKAPVKIVTTYNTTFEENPVGTEPNVFNALESKLKGKYEFKERTASLTRAIVEIKGKSSFEPKTDFSCIRNIVQSPEREEYLLFSEPMTYFIGPKLFLSPAASKLAKSLTDTNKVDVVEFVLSNSLILGIDSERSYGDELDAEIAKIPNNAKYTKEGSESEMRMASMLMLNRIDVWIEYPSVMQHYLTLNDKMAEVTSYSLNHAPDFITGHIACNKSQAAEALIYDINQHLKVFKREPWFIESHLDYVATQFHPLFKSLFESAIKP